MQIRYFFYKCRVDEEFLKEKQESHIFDKTHLNKSNGEDASDGIIRKRDVEWSSYIFRLARRFLKAELG